MTVSRCLDASKLQDVHLRAMLHPENATRCVWEEHRRGGLTLRCQRVTAPGKPWCLIHLQRFRAGQMIQRGRGLSKAPTKSEADVSMRVLDAVVEWQHRRLQRR